MNNMLTIEEVKNFLEVDQPELEKFLKQGKIKAYKIGGTYVRFRKEEVMNLRYELTPKKVKHGTQISFSARLGDFWHYNNFYIISLLLALIVVFFVVRY
ncbi:MAG: helix-turn-helix domain-containing protein [Candidatus Omnitrophica bacterium]|nr:helix-turn-helix domain-containing protein [Candidatus Omnitrophota bacterium]